MRTTLYRGTINGHAVLVEQDWDIAGNPFEGTNVVIPRLKRVSIDDEPATPDQLRELCGYPHHWLLKDLGL